MEKELEKYKKDVTTKVAKALDTFYNYGFHDGYIKAQEEYESLFDTDSLKEYLE